jgi:hypothetical protein
LVGDAEVEVLRTSLSDVLRMTSCRYVGRTAR